MWSSLTIDNNAVLVNEIILKLLLKSFTFIPPIDMLMFPPRIFIYNFNTLLRCWSPHPGCRLYTERPWGRGKASLAIDVSQPGKNSTWSLTISRERISLNQMKGLRRSHKAERKLNVTENITFGEEIEGPAFKKGTIPLGLQNWQRSLCSYY